MGHYLPSKQRDFLTDEEARGVPLVGGGRMSAIRGSAPEHALLRKERRGRLQFGRPDPIVPTRSDELEPLPATNRRKKLGRRVVISSRG